MTQQRNILFRVLRALCMGLLMQAACRLAQADTTYQAPDAFLRATFAGSPPPVKFLWLDTAKQEKLKAIFGHPYPQARLRYWRANGKTAWILEDIGKEFPITAGFVVKNHVLSHARVLVYREPRGNEIHLPSFLKQFDGVKLQDDHFNHPIDAISGATLSVAAMQRMARAALVLDELAK